MTQEFVTLPRGVVEQALAALNASMPHNNDMDEDWPSHIAARRALRAALEQPQVEQETVAWLHPDWPAKKYKGAQSPVTTYMVNDWIPLYTHPQPKREPLTNEQVMQAVRHLYQSDFAAGMGFPGDLDVARAIEAAHNIK